ncbi:MAG: hypothetical protein RR585_10045 [Coprobacillus sp.]
MEEDIQKLKEKVSEFYRKYNCVVQMELERTTRRLDGTLNGLSITIKISK